MCGVIVVMQVGVGLLVTDVMPIYMIIPRYSHNYAQFYQFVTSQIFKFGLLIGSFFSS